VYVCPHETKKAGGLLLKAKVKKKALHERKTENVGAREILFLRATAKSGELRSVLKEVFYLFLFFEYPHRTRA
jgi:hypothetical protein